MGLFDITKGGLHNTEWSGTAISLHGQELDFGGFAKGYFLRWLKQELAARDIENAFVSFGRSSIYAAGRRPQADAWNIGLESPFDGSMVKEFELKDKSLSTSGNTPLYSGHIVNPLTGKQIRSKALVCIVDEDPLEAEVLSTAAFAADGEQFEALEQAFPEASFERFEL